MSMWVSQRALDPHTVLVHGRKQTECPLQSNGEEGRSQGQGTTRDSSEAEG